MKQIHKLIVLMLITGIFYTGIGLLIAYMLDKGFGYGHYYNQLVAFTLGLYAVILFSVIMGIAKEEGLNEKRRND